MQVTVDRSSSTAEDQEKLRLFRMRLQELEEKLHVMREMRRKENRATLGAKAYNFLTPLQAESEEMCRGLRADILGLEQQVVRWA